MSLHYHTFRPNVKLFLSLHSLTNHGAQGIGTAPTCTPLDGRTHSLRCFETLRSRPVPPFSFSRVTLTTLLYSPHQMACRYASPRWVYHSSVSVTGWMLWSVDGLADAALARSQLFLHCRMSSREVLRSPSDVAYKVYCSPITHGRVWQVSDTLTIGSQWLQTMLLHGFTVQSRATNMKGWSALPFMQPYVICDWQVIQYRAGRWGWLKGKLTAIGYALP